MDNDKSENYPNNQHSSVQGDRNNVTQDFNIDLAKPDFFEPNLEQFDSANLTLPKSEIICELLEVIQAHKLLVLNGSLDIDKVSIARHLAGNLSQTLQQHLGNITVKEWYRSSERQSIDVALQTTTTTVFLLIGILPENIGYDLLKLQKAAAVHKHYIIATTDISFADWKQTEDSTTFWRELSTDNLYDLNALVTELNSNLVAAKINLTSINLLPIVSKLKTPGNIASFVQLLATEALKTKKIHQPNMIRLINITQDQYELLKYWFFNILSRRQQILVLNLACFDGLFDSQLFAALERVTAEVGQKREPSLHAPDYLDLDNLSNFFSFINTKDGSKKIESRLPQQRLMLFDIAWQSYKRGILATLAVIVELIKESVEPIFFKQNSYAHRLQRELYFPPIKCQRLRQTLSEVISDIGLIDSSEIIETLVELSAHEDIGVQAVAASAMARWYYYDQEQKLIDTISKLRNYKYTKANSKKTIDERANILATIALTISNVIEYNYPKEIDKYFYNLLEELANELSSIVRQRFLYQILPKLVPLYLVQLKNILRNLVKDSHSIDIIVKHLVATYKTQPQEVLSIFGQWYKDCINNDLPIDTNQEIFQKEALLKTIALTYKEIQLSDNLPSSITKEVSAQLFKIILDSEKSYPSVRQIALEAISGQIKHNFEHLEPNWLSVLLYLTADELKEIIEVLPKEVKILFTHYTNVSGNHISESSDRLEHNTVLEYNENNLPVQQKINQSTNTVNTVNPNLIDDVIPQQDLALTLNRETEQQIPSQNGHPFKFQPSNNEILNNLTTNENISQKAENLQIEANNNADLDRQRAKAQEDYSSNINRDLNRGCPVSPRETIAELFKNNQFRYLFLLGVFLLVGSVAFLITSQNPKNNRPATELRSFRPEFNVNSGTTLATGDSISNFQTTPNLASSS